MMNWYGVLMAGLGILLVLSSVSAKDGGAKPHALVFEGAVIYREAGTVGRSYDGWNSLTKSTSGVNEGDKLKFGKVSGPGWLKVARSGDLSGVPEAGDVGLNQFVVEVKDERGSAATANLHIRIQGADTIFRKGRIAISSDGNIHDNDDWGATAASIAILASQSLHQKLVLYVYSDHVWGSYTNVNKNLVFNEEMIKSAVGSAERFGFDLNRSLFIAGVEDPERSYHALRDLMVVSTQEDPLVVVCGGPMQVVGEALFRAKQKNVEALKHVRVISHSTWNNRHADLSNEKVETPHSGWTWKEMIDAFTDDGVVFDKIHDQNQNTKVDVGFSSTKAGPDGKDLWEPWYFLRDYNVHDSATNEAIRYVWERMQPAHKPDISDAGMIYYLLTGDMFGGPNELKQMLDQGFQKRGQVTNLDKMKRK